MAFLQEYTMLDELGRGGFASVYKVRHDELEYIRAIRVLNETVVDSESKTYRNFLRECKVLLRLGNGSHPNIVHIYQPRLLDNKALVEMDYIDGQDLLHYLKQEQQFVPVEEVIKMARQMSSALGYCHEDIYRFCMDKDRDDLQDDPNDGSKVLLDKATRRRLIEKYKVIHNDIHAGNIMRREDGNYVLLDFGLAINGDEVVLSSSRHANGAPEYKAPEKWDERPNSASIVSEQSDIYSFGIVLYQLLAGRVPFPYDTTLSAFKAEYELGKAHQEAMPPAIEDLRREQYEQKYPGRSYERDFPRWLEEAIMKCLEKAPKDRFKNGKELCEFIEAHCRQEPAVASEVAADHADPKLKERCTQLEKDLRAANLTITELREQVRDTESERKRLDRELRELRETLEQHYCSNCGAPLLPGASFCNQCGTPINH
ncbi:MAG: protein kinase [Paludibacteraceae bacterium]|nr:protein kinase [Paludibacteraceae bacterium]